MEQSSTRSESNSAQSESNSAQSESAKEARGELVVGTERLGLTPLDGANTKYNVMTENNSKLKGKTSIVYQLWITFAFV